MEARRPSGRLQQRPSARNTPLASPDLRSRAPTVPGGAIPSVRRPVLARIDRLPLRALAVGQIDVGVVRGVFAIAVADLQIASGPVAPIDELMPVAVAGG